MSEPASRVRGFTFPSTDGIHQVHAVEWLPPEGEPKAVVQLVHGISEYIARYDAFARFLTAHGYAVVGHDHLGHGRTAAGPEEYGFFAEKDGWRYILKDTHTLRLDTGERFPGVPYFLMGHSMGSFVARGYLIEYSGTVDGCILSGTGQEAPGVISLGNVASSILGKLKGSRAHSAFLNKFSVGAYNARFKPNRTTADWISRDEAVVDAYLADPLCNFLPTIGMYRDIFKGMEFLSLPDNLRKMDSFVPVYLFSGDKDPVGEEGEGVRRVYSILRYNGVREVAIKLYPDGRHEMLNEINREEVFQDTLDWLEEHLVKKPLPDYVQQTERRGSFAR